jgi:hypothetical protein
MLITRLLVAAPSFLNRTILLEMDNIITNLVLEKVYINNYTNTGK